MFYCHPWSDLLALVNLNKCNSLMTILYAHFFKQNNFFPYLYIGELHVQRWTKQQIVIRTSELELTQQTLLVELKTPANSIAN